MNPHVDVHRPGGSSVSSDMLETITYSSEDCTPRYVEGPDGNEILCDSPEPSELPKYSAPDDQPQDPASTHLSASPPRRSHSRHSHTERAKPRKRIGNYTLVSTLGSGSMGKVRLAVHNITQEKLAVKIVPKEHATRGKKKDKNDNRQIRTIRESSIMLLLHHPYIVSLKEMVMLDPYYYLFMEYVNGGQLLDYIIAHGKLKEKHARRFARQIVSALDYCHRNSIVHRDLKIENILISQSGHIKIIDFGLSNLFSPRSQLRTFCGSLYFAAPELLNAKEYTGPEVDVWSFGVVLYVLVCGKVPFDDQSMPALHEKIKRGVVDYPSYLSSDCKNLLSRMLVTQPSHRATISEVIIHPWMNRGYSGPVDNHLPERAPLSLPIDMEVVQGMTGFEFGTEEEIKQQLEEIIMSEQYQNAAKTLAERSAQVHHQQQQHSHHHHHHHHQGVQRFGASHSHISGRKTFLLPNDDPQSIPAAYHPLVSIYYLVKERMDRERREGSESIASDSHHPLDAPSSSSSSSGLRMPTIAMPEVAHPSNAIFDHSLFAKEEDGMHGHQGMFGRAFASGVAYGKKGKTNIRVDDEGHIIDVDRYHRFEHGLTRLFSRTSRHSDPSDEEDPPSGRRSSRESGVLRRLSHAMGRNSIDNGRTRNHTRNKSVTVSSSAVTSPVPIPSKSETRGEKPPVGDRSYSTASATHQGAALPSPTTSHPTTGAPSSGFGQRFSKMLSRRTTTGDVAESAPPHSSHPHRPFHPHSLSHQPHARNRLPDASTAVNSNPVKEGRIALGKAPAQELPLVDSSRRSSEMAHNHQQNFPPTARGAIQTGTADQVIKPVFLKGLFSVSTTSTKHPSVIRADLIRVLERIGVKWRESKGRFECVHVPSIDMNRVISRASSGQGDNERGVNGHDTMAAVGPGTSQGSSGSNGSSGSQGQPITVPDLVVRFEIYIVKVPWLLGMHGLQFRRISGDIWQYKNMCSRILAELKL
ncbi:uncharacterized protein BYT42DRAFT_167466 [Radiomyces spectabilis]|uniref:uncharacterized protein n=1 Tax=Radiomyces spectabilis TaxID=64574 RepID=UPI00221F4EAF|nr:uncharacterized protein BYT42DRAFT_167466 [Radiomyces spectabilis]KAI8364740.1 hypothetical protein BYT42DRAFT_167466 [Radiomyces spectabilis]